MNELESAIASLHTKTPEARLEAIWLAYERDLGTQLPRPVPLHERLNVAGWLASRRAGGDVEQFFIVNERPRWLAHRTAGEKASVLRQLSCPACELVDDERALSLSITIDVDPWSAQSARDRAKIKTAVQVELAERGYRDPFPDAAFCVSICPYVPRLGGRKDVDNLIKGLLDSLEGAFYVNDFQIQCLTVRQIRTTAPTGAYLLSIRRVHPFDNDVVVDDGDSLRILSGHRISICQEPAQERIESALRASRSSVAGRRSAERRKQ